MERLTWAVGPPDCKMKRMLDELASQLSPGFSFQINNYCVYCNDRDILAATHNCPYRDTRFCGWCKKQFPLWKCCPWELKRLEIQANYFTHFELKCVSCHELIPFQDEVRACVSCNVHFCDDCTFDSCGLCNVNYITAKNVNHYCDTSFGKWHKLIDEEIVGNDISNDRSSYTRKGKYIFVWIKSTCIQVWVLGDESIETVASDLGFHRRNKSEHISEHEDFIFFVGIVDPIPGVLPFDQVIKRVSLHDYLQALPLE